jgi:hypothetical protein
MKLSQLNALYVTLSLCIFAGLAGTALERLQTLSPKISEKDLQAREALYLPSGKGLKLISFGFTNVLSDVLWFNTINYFGKHHRSDQNYRWLAHICNLVVDLNPRARHVYDFCGTMLAWEANLPEESVKLLTKAILHTPNDWNLYYQRGFVNLFFLKNSEQAQSDFLQAAALPDAHALVKRLAAKKLAESDNAQAAVEFLTDMLQREKDPAGRAALGSRLREAHFELDFQTLEQARSIYRGKAGKDPKSLQDLVSAGILRSDFKDPFGGVYEIDPETQEIVSSSKHKRISADRRK